MSTQNAGKSAGTQGTEEADPRTCGLGGRRAYRNDAGHAGREDEERPGKVDGKPFAPKTPLGVRAGIAFIPEDRRNGDRIADGHCEISPCFRGSVGQKRNH
ncbi:MAG: hypothetical protein ACLVJO_04170 [[Clostridium] scindens]